MTALTKSIVEDLYTGVLGLLPTKSAIDWLAAPEYLGKPVDDAANLILDAFQGRYTAGVDDRRFLTTSDNIDFVRAVYQGIFGLTIVELNAQAAGVNYWLTELNNQPEWYDSTNGGRGSLISAMLDSVYRQEPYADAADEALHQKALTLLANRETVAEHYLQASGKETTQQWLRDVIKGVSETPASVTAAKDAIDKAVFDDTFTIPAATVPSAIIDGGVGTDTLVITGAGTLDLSEKLINVENINLSDPAAQVITVKATSGIQKIIGGSTGDKVTFSDLDFAGKITSGAVDAAGKWGYIDASKSLVYWDATAATPGAKTITFDTVGYFENAGGKIQWVGTDSATLFHAVYTAATSSFAVTGAVASSGSSVTISAAGAATLTTPDSTVAGAATLAVVDASAVTGTGTLTINTNNFAPAAATYTVKGSTAATVNNTVSLSNKAAGYTGGAGNDAITLATGTYASFVLNGGAGTNSLTLANGTNALTLAAGSSFTGAINGGTGADTLTLAAANILNASSVINLGAGNDVIQLGAAGNYTFKVTDTDTVGSDQIVFGAAGNQLTLVAGSTFSGTITGSAEADTLILNALSEVTGTINLGTGYDTLRVNSGNVDFNTGLIGVDTLQLGSTTASQTVTLHGANLPTTYTRIEGNSAGGADAVVVDGTGDLDLSNISFVSIATISLAAGVTSAKFDIGRIPGATVSGLAAGEKLLIDGIDVDDRGTLGALAPSEWDIDGGDLVWMNGSTEERIHIVGLSGTSTVDGVSTAGLVEITL
jgi:hypothetical protein